MVCDCVPRHNHWVQSVVSDLTVRYTAPGSGWLFFQQSQLSISLGRSPTLPKHAETHSSSGIYSQLCGKPKHQVTITCWSSPMCNFLSVKSCFKKAHLLCRDQIPAWMLSNWVSWQHFLEAVSDSTYHTPVAFPMWAVWSRASAQGRGQRPAWDTVSSAVTGGIW